MNSITIPVGLVGYSAGRVVPCPDGASPAACRIPMPLPNLGPGPPESGTPTDGEHRVDFWHRLSSVESRLWALAVVAMLVDVTLTVHGLQLGLAEMNPVARRALETAGVLGLYVLKVVALGTGLFCQRLVPDRLSALVPLVLLLPSLVAVLVNATLISVVLTL